MRYYTFFFILLSFNSFAQSKCDVYIYYEDKARTGQEFRFVNEQYQMDTVTFYESNQPITGRSEEGNYKIEGTLLDCKGAAELKIYTTRGTLVAEGKTVNSTALLKRYMDWYDEDGEVIGRKTIEYYQPLPDGVWIIHQDGKSYERKFKKGIPSN